MNCRFEMPKLALNLINRQEAENEKNENIIRVADKTIATPQENYDLILKQAVEAIAEEQGCSMFEVMQYASRYAALSRSAVALMNFTAVINELTALVGKMPLGELFDQVADRTGYRQMLIDGGEQEKDRLDNVDEFVSGVIEYMKNNEEPTLTGFLEETALVADVDRFDETADAVVLMTIHSAKGLEFPIVFLPGMEENVFPGSQSVGEEAELEEHVESAHRA